MNRILIKAPLESFAREAVGFSKAFWHFIWRSVLVLSVLFIGRQILIASLGDAVLGLPEFQMERFAGILSEPELFSSDVFVLGDSSAVFSVSAKDLPRTLSLASINSTPMEAFYSLKKILKEGAKPNCILFSGSFSWKANHEFFWPMFVANGFYASGDLKEIYEVSSLNGDPPGNIGRILFEWKSALYGRKIIDGISWGRIQDAIFQYQEKIKRARRFQANVQREKGSNPVLDHSSFEGRKDLVFSASPEITTTEMFYLSRLIELLRSNRIRLFLLEIPFHPSVNKEYGLQYWSEVERAMIKAGKSSEPPFTRIFIPSIPSESYLSAGHIDINGAKLMKPYIMDSMRSCFSAEERFGK